MKAEYEDKIAKIDQKLQKNLDCEAKAAMVKAKHNQNLSKLQKRIEDLDQSNGNYDSVLSSLTRFLSVEASKRNIQLDYERGSRYKGFQGKPYANLHKIQDIMNQILKEFDRKVDHTELDGVNCLFKDELAVAGADGRITTQMMLEKFVTREATERGINVSGEASTMVHAILNELDVTREELIRCKLSRPKSDKSVGAVAETSDMGVSTVTADDFSPSSSFEESRPPSQEGLPPSIGDIKIVTVVIVIEVNEAFLQIVESNPNLAPLKVDLEGLRVRVPDEYEQIRSPPRLPAIMMETPSEVDRHLRDPTYLEFNRAWIECALNLVAVTYIAIYYVMLFFELFVK